MKKKFSNSNPSSLLLLIGLLFSFATNAQTSDFDGADGLNLTLSGGASMNGATGFSPSGSDWGNPDNAYVINNGTGTITTATQMTSATSNFSFDLQSIDGSGSNGADGGDEIIVEISTDDGTSYTTIVTINGNGNGNAKWTYSGGNAVSTAYSSPTTVAPAGGGVRDDDGDGIESVTVTDIPAGDIIARITATNNSADEYWTIDNLVLAENSSPSNITFSALPDCDDAAGSTGTAATDNTMYVHISNLQNSDGTNPTTFTSSAGSVTGEITASATSGTIQITGLSDSDYGTIITLTANNNGNTATIEIPVVICGFSVDNGGDGTTENAPNNGAFCSDQNGITAPGILVEAAPVTALASGNDITSTYVYVLVDNDGNTIEARNNTSLFSSPDVVSGEAYTVYAFNVNDDDLSNFNTLLDGLATIESGDAILMMTGVFAGLCYTPCWNVTFSPDCFECPELTTLTDPADICTGSNFAADITASGFTADQMNQTIGGGAFGIAFKVFSGATAPADAYSGGTVIGTVANADLTNADTEATLATANMSNITTLSAGTYQVCAILTGTPSDATCRPQVCQTFVVNPLPTAEAASITVCDDNTDGFAQFTLTDADATVLDGQTGMTLTYHASQADADGDTDPLSSPYTNTTANSQTIYARVETSAGCYATSEITLTVNQDVTVNAGNDQSVCSTSSVDISGATITGTTTGTWSTSGTGEFQDGSGSATTDFGSATMYVPSADDIASGMVTLTLTTTGATSPCTDKNDLMVITILDVTCSSTFPWSGDNDD